MLRQFAFFALASALLAVTPAKGLARAPVIPPLPVPPVEHVVTAQAQPVIVAVDPPPASVTCADGAARLVHGEAPLGRASYYFPGLTLARENRTAFSFRIAPDGRPLTITRRPDAPTRASPANYTLFMPDDQLESALATWAFAASPQGHADCRVEFVARATGLAETPRERLLTVLAYTQPGPAANLPLFKQAGLADGDCQTNPRPQALELHFPDPDRIPPRPGELQWVMYRFDIDAHGVPVNAVRLAGPATAQLDQAGHAALAAGRYQARPRTGCIMIFRRQAGTLAAPPTPRPGAFRREDDDCPGGDVLTYPGPPTYPPHFAALGVEGWAILRFDVASWGAVGNVEVLAAEPADAFGTYAKSHLLGAKAKTPGRAYRGCILPVHFKEPGATPAAPN